MATTPIEVPKLPAGLTLTCDIYPRGSDTADQSGITLTEATNRKGTYSGDVTSASTGLITIKIKLSSSVVAEITGYIEDDTSIWIMDEGVMSTSATDQIADAVLTRDWSSVTGEAARSVLNALRILRNKVSETGGTLTVTEEDDLTTAWTAVVTTNLAAQPISEIDPA